jgi:hypothetical protein
MRTTTIYDGYGLQPRETPIGVLQAARVAAEVDERKVREAFEAGRAERAAREAEERLKEEVDNVASQLGRGYAIDTRFIESLGWTVTPEGKPAVDRVSLRGLGSISITEAVAKGLLCSRRGVNAAAYERALALANGQRPSTLPPHSAFDEHGFAIEG